MTDLIADVQGEEQHQHAGGRVAPVVPGPAVVHVLEEGGVEDLDLRVDTEETSTTRSGPAHQSREEGHLVLVDPQELLDRRVGAGGGEGGG